jgi:hypothetical protein
MFSADQKKKFFEGKMKSLGVYPLVPARVRIFEVQMNLAVFVFLKKGDSVSFLPANSMMQVVNRYKI